MKLGRVFYFDSSHNLPNYQGACENIHGHTYKLEIVLEDDVKDDGMVLDFAKLKVIVGENVLEKIDHININTLLENPTAENITSWIWDQLKDELPLYSIKLWEGKGKWVKKTR